MSRRIFAFAPLLVLAGCAMPEVPAAPTSISAVEAVSVASAVPIALGDFHLAAGLPASQDGGMGIRGGIIKPQGGSFAHYLRDSLQAQLAAAGHFDGNAPTVLSAEITRTQASSGVGENSGHGLLAVDFVVRRGGTEVFHREIVAEKHWNSSFIGAVAFPEAEQGYMSLYTDIIAELFRDPNLRIVLQK